MKTAVCQARVLGQVVGWGPEAGVGGEGERLEAPGQR